jgi:hypothetical protein
MRIYHDSEGRILFTLRVRPEEAHRAPAGSWIEVPDQDFGAAEAWRVVNGMLTLVDLAPLRAAAIRRINARAGEIRATFVTGIVGQEMLYLAKEEEARAWVADPAPVLANYPLIAAEVGPGLTAPDADDLAQIWLNLGAQWRLVAAQIETARLGAVYAVEAAQSEAEIAAIEAAYQGVLP